MRYSPNVEMIRCRATRVVKGKIPAQVRKELMQGVKDGHLGHLKKDGLKPEVFYHPCHKHGAIEVQKREEEYSKNILENFANVCKQASVKAI